jgi:hypothetical protein
MGRHRDVAADGFDSGRRTTVIIGAIGVLAIALVFGAWWMLSSSPSIGKGATAMSTARVTLANVPGATADVGSTETFVVPTPSFATPTLGVALGSREPEIPGETPTTTLPAWTPTTSSSSSSFTSSTSSSSSSSGRVTVSNLSLACGLQGRRVRATLTFHATGPVSVSLTASTRTENTVASGNVRLDVVGDAPATGTGTCSAKVNGMAVGPIAAS